ncbi:MAG: AraC family transcriptional regulator, partial [Bacteroidia bacterium]|nr:AraC family transcriptional regulator [Bacteroidia bacterium]
RKQKIFPDGSTELIFHYGDRFRKYDEKGGSHIQEKSFIHGQLHKYIEVEPTGKVGIFSARFHPGGLQPFIPLPVSKLTQQTFSLPKVWGAAGTALEKEMLSASSNNMRLKILETFLLEHINTNPHSSLASKLVEAILANEGNISIDELSSKMNLGIRQLTRTFVSCMGIKPKMLARIIRFHKVLKLIEEGHLPTFTAIAVEGGFYDQAHFIKDFREITGLNPKKYFSEDLKMAKLFTL